MRKRNQTLNKYGISNKRYKELCGFCEQYPEWKEELSRGESGIKSPALGEPTCFTGSKSDRTMTIAVRRAMIAEKVALIEETAKEAAPDLWQYIIKSACYEQPFWYIRDLMAIPCNERSFYDMRRYFFFLLNQKK